MEPADDDPDDNHPELPYDPDAPDERPGARPLHPTPLALALVFAGGAVGTLTRYGLELAAPSRDGQWPLGTFVANLAGAFVLGALLEFLARSGDDTGRRLHVRLLLGTGLCGGLTTYSTFAVEADLLVRSSANAIAIAYVVVTVLAGLLATTAGVGVASRLRPRAGR